MRNEYKGDTAAVCRDCERATQEMIGGLCPKCDKKREAESRGSERNEKPPLGLKPRYLHDAGRVSDILGAIARCMAAGLEIPNAWIEEYNEIAERREFKKAQGLIAKNFNVINEQAAEIIHQAYGEGREYE